MNAEEYKARLVEWSTECGIYEVVEAVKRFAPHIEVSQEQYEANKAQREQEK